MTDDASSPDGLEVLFRAEREFSEKYVGWAFLGAGGHGTMIKVRNRYTGDDLALKLFDRILPENRKRFEREVSLVRRVSARSRYFPRAFGSHVYGLRGVIEFEHIESVDLSRELAFREESGTPFAVPEAMAIALDVVRALLEAHEMELIHRDIKPANILLPRSGDPKAMIIDFGIARFQESVKLTRTDVRLGTPLWTSPEHAKGQEAGPPHDIYCCGLTLFALFTGNHFALPITDEDAERTVLRHHAQTSPFAASHFRPGIPPELDQLLGDCLRKLPETRPSARALLDRLTEIDEAIRNPSRPVDVSPETAPAEAPQAISVEVAPSQAPPPPAQEPSPEDAALSVPADPSPALVAVVMESPALTVAATPGPSRQEEARVEQPVKQAAKPAAPVSALKQSASPGRRGSRLLGLGMTVAAAVALVGYGVLYRPARPPRPTPTVPGLDRALGSPASTQPAAAAPGSSAPPATTASATGTDGGIRASLRGRSLLVTNGPTALQDSTLVLLGSSGTAHVLASGPMAAAESSMYPLGAFSPAPAGDERLRELRISVVSPAGQRASVTVPLQQ
jgi:serine/threonine protein kinase